MSKLAKHTATSAVTEMGSDGLPAVWGDTEALREQFGKGLTQTEFGFFTGLGKLLGANPFAREIWAVKYGTNPAQIFLGRDFYRRKAQEQPDYDGHTASPVYENDTFTMVNGKPHHEFRLASRGHLLGAYCVVYKKNINVPYTVFVQLSEYNTGQSNWKTKPATMITKVAEAQALRGAFAGTFKGTYSEDEFSDTTKAKPTPTRKSISEVFAPEPTPIEAQDAEYYDDETGEIMGDELPDMPAITMANFDQLSTISEFAHLLPQSTQKHIVDMGDAITYDDAVKLVDSINKRRERLAKEQP